MTPIASIKTQPIAPQLSTSGSFYMDRYLIAEMVPPFVFGVGAFTALAMAIGSLFELVRLIAEAGLPIGLALRVFGLRAPEMIVLTFPMSMLLSALLAFGRLSGDSEITALRGCGVSLYRMIVPALILSLGVTGVTFLCNELVVPNANRQATLTLNRALDRTQPDFRQENILYQEFAEIPQRDSEGQLTTRQGLARQFYARSFDGRQMRGIVVLDFSNENLNQIILAQTGEWQAEENRWLFRDGTSYIVSPDGTYSNIVTFSQQQIQLSRAPLDIAREVRRPEEMNIQELSRYIEMISRSGDIQQVRRLRVNLHQKVAIPFACVAFVLVGVPLGFRPQRTSSSLGLGLSILIIFGYYVFSFITQALGQIGALGPEVAAWLPNGVGSLTGLVLLYRANR